MQGNSQAPRLGLEDEGEGPYPELRHGQDALDDEHAPALTNPTHEGRPGSRRAAGVARGSWVEAYPDLQVDPLEIQTSGDRAFVWVRFSGHGAGSGVPMEMEIAQVVTVEGGKIRRIEEYSGRADGLEAAGLSE